MVKESLTVKSFSIILDRTETKIFSSFYVGVPFAEGMSLNGDNPILRGLCTSTDS